MAFDLPPGLKPIDDGELPSGLKPIETPKIKENIYSKVESTTKGGPITKLQSAASQRAGLVEDIKTGLSDVATWGKQAKQEAEEHPFTAPFRVMKGAVKRVPAFGERLAELPLGLYSLYDPEVGAGAIKEVREKYGWDQAPFEPSTPLEKPGAMAGDVAIGALETMAPVSRAVTPFQRMMALAAPAAVRGVSQQAGASAMVDVPGETPEEKLSRVRNSAAARGILDVAATTVPYSGALKSALTTPVALGAESLGFHLANKRINEVAGVPDNSSYLDTLGMVLGGHMAGKATEASQPPIEPFTELGPGTAKVTPEATYGKPWYEPQLQRQMVDKTRLAEELMATGMVNRVKERHSPEAIAATTEHLSQIEAGQPVKPTPEVEAVLSDPDFSKLQSTLQERYRASSPTPEGEEPAPAITPRVVSEGLPEGTEPAHGKISPLGRLSHEGQKERSVMQGPGGEIVSDAGDGKFNVWSGGEVVGQKEFDQATLRQADIPSIERETPFRYSRDLPTILAKRVIAEGDVARTRQMEQLIAANDAIAQPKETAPAHWVEPDAQTYPFLKGKTVSPEFHDVLESWKEARSGDKSKAEKFLNEANSWALKAGFQVNPTAHWANEVNHFVKTAAGSPRGWAKLPEAMNRAIEMERSIRAGSPNADAVEYLQANGQLMAGRGGQDYTRPLAEQTAALTGRELTDVPKGSDLTERMTWRPDDRLRMTLAMMNKLGGKSMAGAVADVNQSYPDYRPMVRPTGNKALDTVLDGVVNNPLFVFQRYRRGAYGSIGKSLSDIAEARNIGKTSDAGAKALSGMLKTAGIAANFAALKYILTPAVQGFTGDERDRKAPGGTEHILSDAWAAGKGLAAGNLNEVGRIGAKNVNLSPAVRLVSDAFSPQERMFNPEDLAVLGGSSAPSAKLEAGKSLLSRTAGVIAGGGAESIGGISLEGQPGADFLLGKKRDYTPAERELSDFMGERGIPSGHDIRQTNVRKAILRDIKSGTGEIAGLAEKGLIGPQDIKAGLKTFRAKSGGRELELATKAAPLPFRQYALLMKSANEDEKMYLMAGLARKLRAARASTPEDFQRALADIEEILGPATMLKAAASEKAIPQDEPDIAL